MCFQEDVGPPKLRALHLGWGRLILGDPLSLVSVLDTALLWIVSSTPLALLLCCRAFKLGNATFVQPQLAL